MNQSVMQIIEDSIYKAIIELGEFYLSDKKIEISDISILELRLYPDNIILDELSDLSKLSGGSLRIDCMIKYKPDNNSTIDNFRSEPCTISFNVSHYNSDNNTLDIDIPQRKIAINIKR